MVKPVLILFIFYNYIASIHSQQMPIYSGVFILAVKITQNGNILQNNITQFIL